jgi:hypothetical protein
MANKQKQFSQSLIISGMNVLNNSIRNRIELSWRRPQASGFNLKNVCLTLESLDNYLRNFYRK